VILTATLFLFSVHGGPKSKPQIFVYIIAKY